MRAFEWEIKPDVFWRGHLVHVGDFGTAGARVKPCLDFIDDVSSERLARVTLNLDGAMPGMKAQEWPMIAVHHDATASHWHETMVDALERQGIADRVRTIQVNWDLVTIVRMIPSLRAFDRGR